MQGHLLGDVHRHLPTTESLERLPPDARVGRRHIERVVLDVIEDNDGHLGHIHGVLGRHSRVNHVESWLWLLGRVDGLHEDLIGDEVTGDQIKDSVVR